MAHLVVTGGSRGIGAAVCRLAGARGWAVTVNYRDDAAAAEATAVAVRAAGGEARTVRGDVTREAEVVGLFESAAAALGPVTHVVANAGIVAPASKLADMTAERMARVVEVNVTGTLLTAREAARRLSRARGGPGGALVIVSSMASRLGSPNEYVDYAASKGALDALTLGLARELAPEGVRVNAVRPGLIETEIHASGGAPDRAARLGATTPIGRAGTVGEVAEAVLWLLSDAASYTTGAFIDVSGGR
ncbi:SDR family oxidoreductase [Amaricoccus solimangrovi]|uniref:SDR family oxidoreductase n=1 Tax=Amaricoccus solimangrovi TaxID=2589815 RepID=A0A501WN01_9RHOB|nr:SDR family oxidoreductase [Amaricoccus solimangrovi]TPE49720.1 SDR family oxidoreductase [Amaricoccus solimangrovi]